MNHNVAPAPQDQLPLAGKRIVVTRARPQARTLARAIEQLGGEAIEFPTIAIKPALDLGRLDGAIKNLIRYDWLIFTSANAAKIGPQTARTNQRRGDRSSTGARSMLGHTSMRAPP